jgi:hypothetical protein
MKQRITAKRKGKVVYTSDFSPDANLTDLIKAYEETGCDVAVTLEDRPSFGNFDDYAKLFPDGEYWRSWVTGTHAIRKLDLPYKHYALVPVMHSCLPGDYACVHTSERQGKTFVHVNDGDDFMFRKEVKDDQEAIAEIDNLKLLAPFGYGDLRLFGYVD